MASARATLKSETGLYGGGCARYSERTEKPIADKDGKETWHTRGTELVTGDARIARMANKTEHICKERSWKFATSELPAFYRASYAQRLRTIFTSQHVVCAILDCVGSRLSKTEVAY